jgi:thiol-disulfide isomerase/thioredoxin
MFEEAKQDRRYFLTTAVKTIGALQLGLFGCTAERIMSDSAELPIEGNMPTLSGATSWLNSEPLTANELRGKVVLVNFWTFTCINWLRQLPYVRAWNERYKDRGLLIIGVHTPEFEFEKNIEDVRRASNDMKVEYPVALDSDYAVWNAFENQYWPALYFVDAQGRVRHHQFGEGDYERSEKIIQQLLNEIATRTTREGNVSVEGRGLEAAADWRSLKSPETYVGYGRTENFASPGGVVRDISHTYAAPERLRLNEWSLSGTWTVSRAPASLNAAGGRIAHRFHARDLHLVMKPQVPGAMIRFRVTLDGKPPLAARGTDVDETGIGTVTQPRLYQLIRQAAPIADKHFEIEFLDPDVEVYAFTFG